MKRLDTLAHIFLILGFVVGAVAIVRLRYDNVSQFLVILILCLFYLLWGATYHHIKGDITKKLFLEYLLMAAIAALAGFLVFIR